MKDENLIPKLKLLAEAGRILQVRISAELLLQWAEAGWPPSKLVSMEALVDGFYDLQVERMDAMSLGKAYGLNWVKERKEPSLISKAVGDAIADRPIIREPKLKEELAFYERWKQFLLDDGYEGKYILIGLQSNGDGMYMWSFASREEAVEKGYEKFGTNQQFLVKKIEKTETVHRV